MIAIFDYLPSFSSYSDVSLESIDTSFINHAIANGNDNVSTFGLFHPAQVYFNNNGEEEFVGYYKNPSFLKNESGENVVHYDVYLKEEFKLPENYKLGFENYYKGYGVFNNWASIPKAIYNGTGSYTIPKMIISSDNSIETRPV
jgi:hypothetical protein